MDERRNANTACAAAAVFVLAIGFFLVGVGDLMVVVRWFFGASAESLGRGREMVVKEGVGGIVEVSCGWYEMAGKESYNWILVCLTSLGLGDF